MKLDPNDPRLTAYALGNWTRPSGKPLNMICIPRLPEVVEEVRARQKF
jgi:hypothetical protein